MLDTADLLGAPVLFNAFRPGWGFSEALWRSNNSVDDFLARVPVNAHFVFLSYEGKAGAGSQSARRNVRDLRQLIQQHLAPEQAELRDRFHFVATSVEELTTEPMTSWLPRMLNQYPTFLDRAEAHAGGDRFSVPLLNSRYDWLGWAFWPSAVFGNASAELADFGSGCGSSDETNLTGYIALVGDGGCSYYLKAKHVASRNASGIAVVAASGAATLVSMDCIGDECSDQSFGLPAFMVGHAAGMRLRRALAVGVRPRLRFFTTAVGGTDFGIDAAGRLRQTWGGSGLGLASDVTYGNPGDRSCKLYPTLAFVAWAAQWLNSRQALEGRLAAPAHVVTVFGSAPLRPKQGNCYGAAPWGCGPSSVVVVPGGRQLGSLGRRFTRLELDFALGCGAGLRDVDCPKWDHVVTLLACCGAGRSGGACDASRGFELGRWITPFGRGVGHWLTDVSQLLPLLSGNTGAPRACNMTIFTVPWAGNQGAIPWTGTLRLRFLEPPASPVLAPFRVLRPWSEVSTSEGGGVYELFRWIAFNRSYETYFQPFRFDVPAGTRSAKMLVVLSGHGNDNHGCGEFCITSHRFTLNGHANVKRNSGPDNAALGCADSVVEGTTPNEYGTWLYGRDGWCNGRGVQPWTVDLTSQLRPKHNLLEYRGLFNGSVPDPSSLQQGAPVMMMRVYITLYRSEEEQPGAGGRTEEFSYV